MTESSTKNNQAATFVGWLDSRFGRLAAWCSIHRYTVLLALAVVVVGSGYFASNTRIDNGLDTLFNDDDPTYGFYRAYQEEFYSDEIIYLLYHAPGAEFGPFDIEVMRKIAHLTEALEREVPFVRKVTSLANTEFIEATGDLLEIHDLAYAFPANQREMSKLRAIARSKPIFVNNLISEDGEYAAIVVDMTKTIADPLDEIRLDPDGGDGLDNLYPQASNKVLQEILSRPEYDGIKFYRSGDVPFNAAYNRITATETPIIACGAFALIAIIGALLFPTRLAGLLAPLSVVLVAMVMTVGFIGLMGWSIGLMFTMIPTLICAIGVSQAVHVMLAYQRARAALGTPADAARKAIEEVGTPCLLAALTTAIGLLGMTTSSIKAIAQMAVYAGFGVLVSFVLSITLMVSFSAFAPDNDPDAAPPRIKPAARLIRVMLEWIVAINLHRSRTVMAVAALVFALSIFGVSQLKVDYNFIEEFKPHLELRQSVEQAEAVMGGFISAVYIFDTGRPDGIKDVELLRQIERFSNYAEAKALVRKSQSIVEIIKDLNQALHGDDPAWYKLPEDRDTIAQLLFLYQMSGGEEINDFINFDASQTVVQLRVRIADASEVRGLLDELRAYLDARPLAGVDVKTTGMGVLWVSIADYIADSQIRGYLVVFVLIFLFIFLAYGSLKVSVMAMAANLTPILLILGLMGFLEIKLDYMRLLLATIAIGIAVDDTIHLLTRYKVEFNATGDYRLALENALLRVGPAMVTTTIILVVSFLTYLYSDLAVLASFGMLLSGAVFFALIADLFLLPVLILVLQPFGPNRARQ